MTIQISDAQLEDIRSARSAISNAILRNRVRHVDVELISAGAALDRVLDPRRQSEQTPEGGPVPGSHGSPTDDRI